MEVEEEEKQESSLQLKTAIPENFFKTRYKIAMMLMVNLGFAECGKMAYLVLAFHGLGIPKDTLELLRKDLAYPYSLIYPLVNMIPSLAAGRLAEMWNAKWILFTVNLFTTAGMFMVPLAAETLQSAAFMHAIFFVKHFFEGCTLPVTHVLLSRWAPPNERFPMGSLVYCGIPLGGAISTFLTTWAITAMDWHPIFYSTATLSIIWLIPWVVVLHNDPSRHNGMNKKEASFILSSLADEVYQYKRRHKSRVPWKQMLHSSSFWSAAIMHIAFVYTWAIFTKLSMDQATDTMRAGDDKNQINQAVILSMPKIYTTVLMWLFSLVAFNLIEQDVMTLVEVYKLGGMIGLLGMALNVPNYYLRKDLLKFTVMLNSTLALFIFGFVSTTQLITLDIAPNYAGTIVGIFNVLGQIPGFFWRQLMTKKVTGYSEMEWLKFEATFMIGVVLIAIVVGIVYCSSDLESWNNHSHLLKRDHWDDIDLVVPDGGSGSRLTLVSTFTASKGVV